MNIILQYAYIILYKMNSIDLYKNVNNQDEIDSMLTYQTGKSDAVDGNRNDAVTVCHEAPPGMFRSAKNPNADSSQEAMFKEKLTSQTRITCTTYVPQHVCM